MNWLSIVQLVVQWAPTIKGLIDVAESNSDLVTKIKQTISSPLLSWIEAEAAKLFPKAAPEIQTVGGIIAAFDPNLTKWIQGSVNKLLGTELSPQLVVDGIYGPKTIAAIEQLQTKLGLKVDGVVGQKTETAILAELGKLLS